jgi:hypothetical protein
MGVTMLHGHIRHIRHVSHGAGVRIRVPKSVMFGRIERESAAGMG